MYWYNWKYYRRGHLFQDRFKSEPIEDACLEIEDGNFRLSDNDAKKIIKKISGCVNVIEFQELKAEKRDKYIEKFIKQGLSIRQINRLTGISKGLIEKISKRR